MSICVTCGGLGITEYYHKACIIRHWGLPAFRGLRRLVLPQVTQILYNDLSPAGLVNIIQYHHHERPRWHILEPSSAASPAAAAACQTPGAPEVARSSRQQMAPSSGNVATAAHAPVPAAGLAAGNGKVHDWLAGASRSIDASAVSSGTVQYVRAGSGSIVEAASTYTSAASSTKGSMLCCSPAASHP